MSNRSSYGELLDLLAALVDPDPCEFDHHGGCQAHGYLSLEPGELCPHEHAKRILAAEVICSTCRGLGHVRLTEPVITAAAVMFRGDCPECGQ